MLVVLDELDRLVVDGMVGVATVQFDSLAVAKEMGVICKCPGGKLCKLGCGGKCGWELTKKERREKKEGVHDGICGRCRGSEMKEGRPSVSVEHAHTTITSLEMQ